MIGHVGSGSFHPEEKPLEERPGEGGTNVTSGGSGVTQADVNRALPQLPLPQLNTRQNVLQKVFQKPKLETGKNAANVAKAASGAVDGSAHLASAYGATGAAQVAAGAAHATPALGIIGGGLQFATSANRLPRAQSQANELNEVMKKIPQGGEFNTVRDAATYALSQTETRSGHLAQGVFGGALGVAGGAATLTGHGAVVGVPLSAAGVVASGGPTRLLHNLQKRNTVIKSGAGDYNALGVDRNVHAINLRHLLGDTPAGENETNTPKYHAEQVVTALGVDPNDVRSALPQEGQDLIAGKLRSW